MPIYLRLIAAVLPVIAAVLTAACASLQQADYTPDPQDQQENKEPPYDIPKSALLAYQDHFGEFGGNFVSGHDNTIINIFITSGNFDPALRQEAEERFDNQYGHRHRTGKLIIHQSKYSQAQLKEWYTMLNKRIWAKKPYNFHSGGVHGGENRISYRAKDLSMKPAAQEVMTELGIPLDAVIFEQAPQPESH